MTFLDPYSKNRRIPPLVMARLILLGVLVGLFFAGRWLWGVLA